jgi:colicin import membrane protein
MKALLLILPLWGCAFAALAQDGEPDAAIRSRIGAERKQVEAQFSAEEKACYNKFAVNDCLARAKSKRREAIAELKRQEVALDDAQRKRAAAERMRSIEEKSRPQSEDAARRAESAAEQQEREARAAEKRAERARTDASAPAIGAARTQETQRRQAEANAQRTRADKEAEENRKQYEQRQAEAEAHKAALNKRQAERNKPAASALPLPP